MIGFFPVALWQRFFISHGKSYRCLRGVGPLCFFLLRWKSVKLNPAGLKGITFFCFSKCKLCQFSTVFTCPKFHDSLGDLQEQPSPHRNLLTQTDIHLRKTNTSPLPIWPKPQRKPDRLPATIFQGLTGIVSGSIIYPHSANSSILWTVNLIRIRFSPGDAQGFKNYNWTQLGVSSAYQK